MKSWVSRLLRLTFRAGLVLVLVLVFLLVLATQTPFGKEAILRTVLGQVGKGIQGAIQVDSISSPGLLNGFTFRGVVIRGEDDGPFLVADSIRAGVSAPALFRGDLVFTGVRLWGPRVTLQRLPGEELFNAVLIFTGRSPPDSGASSPDTAVGSLAEGEEAGSGSRRTILLRDAHIHDGSLDILLPLDPARSREGRFLTEEGPAGPATYRRLSFREIEMVLGQAVLRAPDQRGERFEVEDLSFRGEVWPDPFRVAALKGEIRREGERLVAALETLRLPNSEATGQVDVRWGADGGIRVAVQGEATSLDMQDISFIEDRLPRGTARGSFGFDLSDAGLLLDFQGTELASPLGGITARGGLFLGEEMEFQALDMELRDLDLAVTDPWVEDTLTLRGTMRGDLFLTGTLEELALEGVVDVTDPDSVGMMRVDMLGRIGVREGFSASSLRLTIAPLEWGVLASVSPHMKLRGPGAVRLLLTGSLTGDGLSIDEGELTHFPLDAPTSDPFDRNVSGNENLGFAGGASRVTLGGTVRRDSTSYFLDLVGELSPLSLSTIQRSYPDLPVAGEYSGRVEARGPLSDLEVEADLNTSGGPLRVAARFDALRPSGSYTIRAEADEEFLLSRLLPALPDPTRLSGRVVAEGRGLSLDSLEVGAQVELRGGGVGPLQVDSARARGSVQGGLLELQDFFAETSAGRVEGRGSFGLASWAPGGEMTLEVRSESLEALRPFLMEEPDLVLDELDFRRRDLLVREGVDLDTLPTAADVAVGGSLQGSATLSGGIARFHGQGTLAFQDLRLRSDYVQSGEVTFSGRDLPGTERTMEATLRIDSLNLQSLGFRGGTGEVEIAQRSGRIRFTAERSAREEYALLGTFGLDTLGGGTVNLDQFTVRFDSIRWNLGGPASFAWSRAGYSIRDFQLIRPGLETMRVRADGFLPLPGGGETDFELDVERLDLSRLARVAQIETPLEGVLNVTARMTGSPRDPRMVGSVQGRGLLYGDFSLGRLESDFDYGQENLDLELTAWEGEREVLAARGNVPLDLRVQTQGPRIPDAPVDLSIVVDSFPAAITLAFMEALEEVEGTVTGTVHLGGASSDLEPRGDLYLADGSAVLPALGVRHTDVQAHLALSPDGTIVVDGALTSGGRATVTGTVTLVDPASNPELNLSVEARDFLAVDRRDVQGRLSGSLSVEGRYRRPFVEGDDLTVEQGVLMVEEIARSVEVVDLSDRAFWDVVDTDLVTLRPIIQSSQNPFLQNLRLIIDLTMTQNSWLRGRDLNVEMAGNLGMVWDRTERDLAFLGVLDAVRGVYTVFGRQFQVEGGTVSFPGTPGVNPDLDIRARNRIRTSEDVQLDIVATVEGPLLEPRVSLSSNAAFPIAESDLVSYLIFGRPSFATATAQGAYAREAAGAAFAGAASSLAVGLFSSELGSILAEDVGLDYLAVTQGQGTGDPLGMRALRGTVATTQVEIGQYLTEDIFAALHWRPWTAGTNQRQLAALRVETRLWDHWTLEGYWEDRFYRNPFYQVGSLGLDLEEVFGFFLYREWGY